MPDMFQGWGRKKSYFEGWYYKIVNPSSDRIYAVIPGISIDKEGKGHSFIQLLDGINNLSEYYTFSFEEFRSANKGFNIDIGDNHFTDTHIKIDLPGFQAELDFNKLNKWPNRWYSPGIMGPYTFAPFMECNHGVLSMLHSIKGIVRQKDTDIDFTGGRGYTEKDWGHSFPSAYVWLQSNHFDDHDTSIKMSIANIPWLNKSFTGFIAGILCKGILYEFTTYNSSKLTELDISLNKISVTIANNNYILNLKVEREKATKLASPISGEMSGHIMESMRSKVEVSLKSVKDGTTIYKGKGSNTALEVAGDIETLAL